MDGDFFKDLVHLLFRWLHVVAGVLWIGHLYFFNFVNAQVAKTYDADSKKKVVPELMPRALYFFRWGAAWTWISGIVLLGYVYHMNRALMGVEGEGSIAIASLRAFSMILVIPALYDMLWARAFKGKEQLGVIVSSVLLIGVIWYLDSFLPARAAYIHLGSIFGTMMAMNVWMRIWPSQRKIIGAIKEGKGPDADVVALAGLRSKHNTYMSVPLLFIMVSNHFPLFYGFSSGETKLGWVLLVVVVAVGWGVTKWIYGKSATDAPKAI